MVSISIKIIVRRNIEKIIARSLEDLGELKKVMDKVPRCKNFDSTRVRTTGKNRDSLYCDDCGWAG